MSFDDLPRDIRYIVLDYIESIEYILDNRDLWHDYCENNKKKRLFCYGNACKHTIALFEGFREISRVSIILIGFCEDAFIFELKHGNNDAFTITNCKIDFKRGKYVWASFNKDVNIEADTLYELLNNIRVIRDEPLVLEKLIRMINEIILNLTKYEQCLKQIKKMNPG